MKSDSIGRLNVLRRAENVTLSRAPFGRITVQVGKKQYRLQQRRTKEEWAADRARQQSQPVCVLSTTDRNLWQFQGRFYWDNDALDGSQVYALLVTRGQREQQRIERAQAMVAMGSVPRRQVRGAIPDDLKQYVWQRDGGRCRHCGNQHELQYDHIIPVVMGGATSAENLQILCGPCNRRKSAGLTVR
ncbi:MAG: HNH endonuclease [Streptosporangiaceae bacterium]